MATNGQDPIPPKAGGLWARLFGVKHSRKSPEPQQPEAPKVEQPMKEAEAFQAGTAELPPAQTAAPASEGEPAPAANHQPAPAAEAETATAVAEAEPKPETDAVTAAKASPTKEPALELEPITAPEVALPPVAEKATAPEPPAPVAAPVAAPLAAAVAEAPPVNAIPRAMSVEKPVAAVAAPVAVPVATPVAMPPAPPVAVPVAVPRAAAPVVAPPVATPVAPQASAPPPVPVAAPVAPPGAPPPTQKAPPAQAAQVCPGCRTPRKGTQPYCDDCGYMFGNDARSSGGSTATMASASPSVPAGLLKDRYQVTELLAERPGVSRFRAVDHGAGGRPVVIVRGALPEMAEALLLEDEASVPEAVLADDDLMPAFDEAMPVAKVEASGPAWPSVGWELALLEKVSHPALPAVIETFADGQYEYLVEEVPQGSLIWDLWTPENEASARYTWLEQIAEGLHALHQAGAIVEGIRPDIVTITDAGQAMLNDLTDLLPLPVPPGTPLKATLYTAPELVLTPEQADARADLYSFGAMLYSLEYLGHTLEEKDFERQFAPRLITDRYPDVHPTFFRLICKTFTRDLNTRFPTDEAGKEDKTGFTELIRTLDACRRNFDNCRLDIAAWTTTGMVRTGNEDAFAFMQAVEQRQDDLTEYAVLLLADGMGGYEAGEVAAAMCVSSLRTYLLQQPMFSSLAGKEAPAAGVFQPETCKKLLEAALRHANKEVFTAARAPGKGRRGMGCTAEAVYVDGQNIVVGHVGDSRTYHLSSGRLTQLTRDQTLVNRLVELGQLTEEEAEEHPRKNELQQAIGGQPDVMPGVSSAKLKRGDWVLVCSDGLTNHIPTRDLEKMLTRETAGSAEEAARRLLNLVNLRGATDNATIVVIRAV